MLAPSGTGQECPGYAELNAATRWKDVPEPVRNDTLESCQVLRKWQTYVLKRADEDCFGEA